MRSFVVRILVFTVLTVLTRPVNVAAQSFPTDDPVLHAIWDEGTERSQVETLSQALLDSLGPRLTGSPELKAASDWVIATYQGWGIPARAEAYGTWLGWRRGVSHVDLIRPRVRTLTGEMLAWSPGTPQGSAIEAAVVLLPALPDSAAFASWLPAVEGRFVAVSFPEPTCRPDDAWREYTGPDEEARMRAIFTGREPGPGEVFVKMQEERNAARSDWQNRVETSGYNSRTLPAALEAAGAVGILTTAWSGGYGARQIFQSRTEEIPTFSLSCEDYGLVARLAARNQGPVIRAQADAEFLGTVPTFNTIAEMRGTETPDEFVVLSAHFDSWDGSSGATDNGTGTVVMMEAMRILRAVYPNPKRTIVAGHWNSEEQGLNGSSAYANDHPEVVAGLQALFNQDNGTGRIASISPLGLVGASEFVGRWVGHLPDELSRGLRVSLPGSPFGGGSDHFSFICAGAPAFSLTSAMWDYFRYTWHTNLDTFDKIVLENVRQNALITAMLAYLAAKDPETVPRDQRIMPVNPRTGEAGTWPQCRDGARTGP